MLKSPSFQSRSLPYIITFLLLMFWLAMVYHSSLNLFPSHVHAWTQSDRYALTIGYLDNGFGLFKPSTPNLWPKYPPETMPEKLEGITKADLPLTEYLAAKLMWIAGTRHPLFHRGLNLLFSLAGLMLLFALMLRMKAALPMAWLAVSFALLSPVYAYYLDGFIPGIPAMGITLAAYYFFYRYSETGKTSLFAFSIGLVTLAALIRPPMLMALPALALVSTFNFGRKNIGKVLLISVVGLTIFGLFQLHNHHLAANYGSLFISRLMPAGSFAELLELMLQSIGNWKLEYFSYVQYLVMVFAVLLLLIFRRSLPNTPRFALLIAASMHLAAATAYFVVMAKQFPDHDYYFLESFFLPLVLITAVGLSLPQANNMFRKLMFGLAFVLTSWLMADAALASREKRYTTQPWDMTETTRQLFDGSAGWLDENGIARDAKVLVLDSYTTNVPLLMMERKGFTVINTTRENLQISLDLPFDYVAVANRSLPADVLRNLPQLSAWLVPVANNGRIGLYRLNRNDSPKQLSALIVPSMVELIPTVPDSIDIDDDTEFFELARMPFTSLENMRALAFEAMAKAHTTTVKDLHLVVDISNDGGNVFYDSFRLDPFFEESRSVSFVGAYINLPQFEKPGAMLKCYLWNAGRNHIILKNPLVEIMHFENLKTHKQ
jgi:hypothetical protein